MNRCSKCLLPETFPHIRFNKDNVCNYCVKYQNRKVNFILRRKEQLRKKMEELIEENRNKGGYDCLVCLSGGKDSTYLLYLLKEEYKLNCLAYTCDTGFMSEVAHRNIRTTIDKLNVDHVWRNPPEDFYRKSYSYLLTHPSRKGYVNRVCSKCYHVTLAMGMKIAMEKDIPLVALGFSPAQIPFLIYKLPKIYFLLYIFLNKRSPRALFNDVLDDKDREYFEIPRRKKIPHILYPFLVLDYDINKNIKKITDLGLIAPGDEDPLVTNCLINLLMIYLDTKKLRYNPYALEFSRLVREGKLDCQEWLRINERMSKEIENDVFESEKINLVLERLGLTKRDLLR